MNKGGNLILLLVGATTIGGVAAWRHLSRTQHLGLLIVLFTATLIALVLAAEGRREPPRMSLAGRETLRASIPQQLQTLQERVLVEEHVVSALVEGVNRQTAVPASDGPLLSILLHGPEGIGKATMAEALAHSWFEEVVVVDCCDNREKRHEELVDEEVVGSWAQTRLRSALGCLVVCNYDKGGPDLVAVVNDMCRKGKVTTRQGRSLTLEGWAVVATGAGSSKSRDCFRTSVEVKLTERLILRHIQRIARSTLRAREIGVQEIERDFVLACAEEFRRSQRSDLAGLSVAVVSLLEQAEALVDCQAGDLVALSAKRRGDPGDGDDAISSGLHPSTRM